jgi:hypothetical protein
MSKPHLAVLAAISAATALIVAACTNASPADAAPALGTTPAAQASAPAPADPFPIPDEAGVAKSDELANQAHAAFANGDFAEAANLYAQATDANKRNGVAWYNRACSLSMARSTDPMAADLPEIITDLENSLILDSERAASLMNDQSLGSLQEDQSFKELVTRFNGQARPVIIRFQSVNSFEGDISFIFLSEDGVTELVFHGGEPSWDLFLQAGLVTRDGDRYLPAETKAGAPFNARYRQVSGLPPSSGMGEGEAAVVTTHAVLMELDGSGFDAGV